MFKNIKIGSRLGIGFGLILLLFTAVTVFDVNRMAYLSSRTAMMYKHPLTVSNAVLRIDTNIIKMHRSMKDVALSKSIEEIDAASGMVNAYEKDIYRDFNLIAERFLGEKKKHESAFDLFVAWKPIRDEVIALMMEGEKDVAAAITKGKGADHVIRIEEAMSSLSVFAQAKAATFLSNAEDSRKAALVLTYVLVAVSLVLGVLLAVLLTGSITRPIAALRDATFRVGQGNLDTTINIESGDELGELASDFNNMTRKLMEVTVSRDDLLKEIKGRKHAEKSLMESEELYHSLMEAMNEGLAMMDENGRFNYANKQFCKIMGYSMSEIIGAHWMALYDEAAQKVILGQLEKRIKGSSESYELENTKRDGKKVWISISPNPMYDEGGNLKGSMGLVQDITERKKAEQQIKASLNEKELLLGEVHHRVKNNMQVVSSLLKLQAERLDDKEYAAMLKESQLRIQSMSLIHEKLYLSKDFTNIDFKRYVKALANSLIKSHGVNSDKISLRMEIEDVSLDIENAIPCGLIINELISNSLKYAFPEERGGEIRISLNSDDEGFFELIVADDGIGMSDALDIRNTDTLGLYLVTMLTERQLEGELELKREAGTEYIIRFKRQDYKPRI